MLDHALRARQRLMVAAVELDKAGPKASGRLVRGAYYALSIASSGFLGKVEKHHSLLRLGDRLAHFA
jgi:hypothetical protein